MHLFAWLLFILLQSGFLTSLVAAETNANRLTYLDENDPFYVHREFPKLTTPQWVGEEEVEAVVTLAIDDMQDSKKYEAFLRPILERLKKIEGRAPVSVMANVVEPADPQLQAWLKEGLSLEVHTLSHPCPLFQKGSFTNAWNAYHGGVELLNQVSGNQPVAFRMPCCDSMNSPSPRFYAEIFNRVNSLGQFLSIDSSVMNISTVKDTSLPREWVADPDGRERFRKYFPTVTNAVTLKSLQSFVTTIDDYPYPYVIGKLCWEFPTMIPSDWEAFNVRGPTNAATVADFMTGIDIAVRKQGTFNLIFHPHAWIRNDQIVELIDYAVSKYGKKVKFLTFREAQELINKHLLLGQPLRAKNGQDNGVRLLDVNNDGYLDVVIGNSQVRKTRVWEPKQRAWSETGFPVPVVLADADGNSLDAGVRFGVVQPQGGASILVASSQHRGVWHFTGNQWMEDKAFLAGLMLEGKSIQTTIAGRDRGVRLRDADNDGRCEVIVGNESQNAVLGWDASKQTWKPLSFGLPPGTSIVNEKGEDNGLRFTDVNEDGHEDVVFSNEESWSLHLYISEPVPHLGWLLGWSHASRRGGRGDHGEIPMIVRAGEHRNNGAWIRARHLWVQNEDTAQLPDPVDRRSFERLLAFEVPPPKSPMEALKTMRARPGFKVELVAQEPLVKDPVAFEWGEDGRLWVVEMGDYPLGIDGKGKFGGIVRYLEDTDGDGRYDKSTVFLEGVGYPNGVMPWRKGVLVSAAPEIFYAEDTDGDGKADVRKPLFTGFNEGNQQHRVNGFEYGLDNWLYAANGDSGGTVLSALTGKSVNIQGRDVRFRPDDGAFETQPGQTQYGRRRDDWGNWFGNNNPTWIWHYHLPEQYLVRNPHLAVRSTRVMLFGYPDAERCFPTSPMLIRWNQPQAAGMVTSGSSPAPYRDELFGPECATSVFICEPVHNLVHCEVLEPDGITFTSHRAKGEETSDFLTSTDNWCRPVMTKTGPDGALYVADMYRFVIEHPEWMSPEAQKAVDLRIGADLGRIYRVYPEGAVLRKPPRLDRMTTIELVSALDSPNGWQRDTAQRLIVHRADPAAIGPLKKLVASSLNPKARMQALCTLDGLGTVDVQTLTGAWQDTHPAVREQAIRISEPLSIQLAALASGPLGLPVFTALVNDPSIRVRYQLAFSLGEWRSPQGTQIAARLLTELARKDFGDPHMQTAILSSVPTLIEPMLAMLFSGGQGVPPPPELVEKLLGQATAMGGDRTLVKPLSRVAQLVAGRYESWQFNALAGFLDGLERRNLSLEEFSREAGSELKAVIEQFGGLFAQAREMATVQNIANRPPLESLPTLRILGRGVTDQEADLARCGELLTPHLPVEIQRAALNALKRARGRQVADILVARWKECGPSLRPEVLNILFSRVEWIQALLTAVESTIIPAGQISTEQRQKMLAHSNTDIRSRATRLFATASSDRQKVVKAYESVGDLKGIPNRGHELFRQNCMTCHMLHGEGTNVGPDMSIVAGKSVDAMVIGILDPNQALDVTFTAYSVETTDGREFLGIMTAETPNSVTIRSSGGLEETVLRREIRQLASSGLSLMPEGFEVTLKPQDIADLIAYITSGRGK